MWMSRDVSIISRSAWSCASLVGLLFLLREVGVVVVVVATAAVVVVDDAVIVAVASAESPVASGEIVAGCCADIMRALLAIS